MATKNRKRKIPVLNNDEQNIAKEQENNQTAKDIRTADGLINYLNDNFLVKHPKELLKFWEHAKQLNSNTPTEVFVELQSLKLVGPFSLLEDINNKNTKRADYLTKYRYSSDLPEMQTLMLYRGGRFCYWRDTPNEQPEYIIHVPNEPKNFPVFTIVGDRNPFCIVAYLHLNNSADAHNRKHYFSETFDLEKYNPKYLQKLKMQRSKESYGKPFHGMGIKVRVNEKDIGYRPVTDDVKRLKRDIEQFGTSDSEVEKKTLKEKLFQIYSYVQFANDEMDFGMGLEFGHDLFISNYECFDGMARSVLSTAYGLLGRNEFSKILEKHLEYGRRNNDKELF